MRKSQYDDKNNSGLPDGDETPSKEADKPDSHNKKIRPDLIISEVKRGMRFGDTYIRTRQSHQSYFRKVGPGHFMAEPESHRPAGLFAKFYRILKKIMLGRPLETAEEIHQRLNKFKALAVFGSDAISSSAYATEAALVILMSAGNGALHISFYAAIAIVILLAIIAFSYRQTVYAYPNGGGSYIVSRENLGVMPGLIAAAALMIDYVLTVSVSIGAGAAAVTSALIASGYDVSPSLNIVLSLIFIGLITFINLRGIRESGTIFSIPTYLFIAGLSAMLAIGLFKSFTGTLHPASPPPVLQAAQPITLWLILRSFSAGSVAMSGTEAISNGVTAFQKPEPRNASRTLIIMAAVLGAFFLGVSYLSMHMGLVPGDETIISQVARAVFGTNAFYIIFQIATTGILIIAANTAFAGFPRLASIMARDDYMPHQFMDRGDRLAFSTGILALGAIAALLIVMFQGNVNNLIHLYAVGVFLAFCLSNSGMVVHWWKKRGRKWKSSIVINGVGAVVTASILIICVVTKFWTPNSIFGAWIVVLLIPLLVAMFLVNHRHYVNVAKQLTIVPEQLPSLKLDQVVIVPIEAVDYASLRAIAFARTITPDAIILHVTTDSESAAVVKLGINTYAPDLKLIVVESPYRSMVQPLLSYVNAVHSQRPAAFVTIVLPELITVHWWEKFLHDHTSMRLRKAFERHPNIALVLVPYLLEK